MREKGEREFKIPIKNQKSPQIGYTPACTAGDEPNSKPWRNSLVQVSKKLTCAERRNNSKGLVVKAFYKQRNILCEKGYA